MRFKNKLIISFFVGVSCLTSCAQNSVSTNVSKTAVAESIEIEDIIVKILPVQTGAEITTEYLPLLQNKKVGLVANHTSYINQTHLVDTFIQLGVNIQRVFAPEHGFRGDHDAGANIKHGTDEKTGLPIFSLHGSTKKPSVESLAGIEVMVFDIQDVGARFYTYISTLHYVMEACAENNIPLIVLDRPNPNGHYVDGPVLKMENQSFIGKHPVPVVYGMTIGEYAQMINGEKWLKNEVTCDLTVVELANWNHQTTYNLPIPPSPNLPNQLSIYLYPSLCFLEGTEMNEGRGTEIPFQVYGHPNYADTSFSYTPKAIKGKSMYPKFKEELCYGKDLSDLNPDSIQKWNTINWTYLLDAYQNTKTQKFFNRPDFFVLLEGQNKIIPAIQNNSLDSLITSWKPEIDAFKTIRKKYLIYE